MLGDVAVVRRISRHRDADRRRHETARLVGRRFGDDGEHDLSRSQHAHAFFAIHELAVGRKDRAHAHEIEIREMRVAQRHFEAREFFLVPPNAFGQKGLGRDEHACVDQPAVLPSYHTPGLNSTGGSVSPPRSTVACITCANTSAGLNATSVTSILVWPRSLPRTMSMYFAV